MADQLDTAIARPDLTHSEAALMEISQKAVAVSVAFGDGTKTMETDTVRFLVADLTSAEKEALKSIAQRGVDEAVTARGGTP